MTTLSEIMLHPGTIVIGKWKKGQYTVERLLGQGANGKVYLVKRGVALYAMKIGYDPADLQSEVNVLQAVQRTSRSAQRYLLEVDDYYVKGQAYPFYIMKYVKGHSVSEFIQKFGSDWLHLLGRNLLTRLGELHGAGWVFGDLKPENVIVTEYGGVELIDYGGVTPVGRSVKQFTELFDRGFWGCGSRSADAGYDLFAFAVMMLFLADPEKKLGETPLPQLRNAEYLADLTNRIPACRKVKPALHKALKGEYASASEMAAEWRRLSLIAKNESGSKTKSFGWVSGVFAVSLALFIGVLFFVLRSHP